MKRRRWLASTVGLGGALLVGWGLLPPRSRLGPRGTLPVVDGRIGINGWIGIAADGAVQLAMPRCEMGQGVHTALAMLAADELDVPLARVQLLDAGDDALYGNVAAPVDTLLHFERHGDAPAAPGKLLRGTRWVLGKLAREAGVSVTAGSSSVADAWAVLPLAAATARAQLLGAASLQWRLPVAELQVVDGVVSHPSGVSAPYGALARAAAATPPGEVEPKARARWVLNGTPAARLDLPAKVDGSARFGLDVRQPGQLFAVVLMPPVLGGSPGRVDAQAALQRPGVLRIVRLPPYAGAPAALAVVGRTTWHALQGARTLAVEWRGPPDGRRADSAAILDGLADSARRAAAAGGGRVLLERGDAAAALAAAPRRLSALYRAPYLAHAAMEPMNCTARVADGRVELWAPTQAPSFARAAAAHAAGIDEDAVTLHLPYLGGSFGRRLEVDVVAQAVRVAVETGGRPVQLMWTREEDFTHDFYRPAAALWLEAALDDDGRLLALRATGAGDAVAPRYLERTLGPLARPLEWPDPTAAGGQLSLPYDIPQLRVAQVATRHPVPVGPWRSAGHSQHGFFTEAFIDELAAAAHTDPVAWRLAALQRRPRHAEVLRLAAARAGWGSPLPAGRARGVALHACSGTVVAEVVEASIETTADGRRRPRVHRVVVAVDCGTVLNPGIATQQVESGVMFGLATALYGRIDIRDGVVQQRNFPDQPLPTLAETPQIETHFVPSTATPGGLGELATPPLAPALAGALFALTGQRLRELPLQP